MLNILKKIAFVAIMALTAVGCQKDELGAEKAINAEAQRPELPAEINITSATQLPEGATLTARLASTNVTAYDVQGTYKGLLHNVVMNGKKKGKVEELPIHITAQGSNKFRFYMPPFQVGSMPGKLSVDINNLTLNSNGTFHATNTGKDVQLELPFFGPFNYNVTLIDGSFTPVGGGYKLNLILESEGTYWSITIFRAHVEYDGEKQ